MRGPNFLPVHELLDTVVTHAREFADLAAGLKKDRWFLFSHIAKIGRKAKERA